MQVSVVESALASNYLPSPAAPGLAALVAGSNFWYL
jgi:hypothetical protein